MFPLGAARYYLYRGPPDIRRSYDGLCELVHLGQNPMSGDVFIFINKPRNWMKLLKWEPGGFVLFYKEERGTRCPILSNPANRSKTATANRS